MLMRHTLSARAGNAEASRVDRTIEVAKSDPETPNGGTTTKPPFGDRPPPLNAQADMAGSARTAKNAKGGFSIISNDLTIVGQGLRIVTKGTVQVDGMVEGDVAGQEVIIGEKGRVCGVVSGETVEVHGEVSGTVKGRKVALRPGARVSGDVHHHEIIVDQGAHLDGRVRRPQDLSELIPNLD